MGEIDNDRNLTIRTSIIGPELKANPTGLFEWLRNMKNKTIQGYSKVYWGGVTTLELSKFILWVLQKDVTGIVHATNGIPISKMDLLEIINDRFNLNVTIESTSDYRVNKSLINSKIDVFEFASYSEMIDDLYSWIENNRLS